MMNRRWIEQNEKRKNSICHCGRVTWMPLHGNAQMKQQRKRQFYGMILALLMWIVNVVQGITEIKWSGIWGGIERIILNKNQLDLLNNNLHAEDPVSKATVFRWMFCRDLNDELIYKWWWWLKCIMHVNGIWVKYSGLIAQLAECWMQHSEVNEKKSRTYVRNE